MNLKEELEYLDSLRFTYEYNVGYLAGELRGMPPGSHCNISVSKTINNEYHTAIVDGPTDET